MAKKMTVASLLRSRDSLAATDRKIERNDAAQARGQAQLAKVQLRLEGLAVKRQELDQERSDRLAKVQAHEEAGITATKKDVAAHDLAKTERRLKALEKARAKAEEAREEALKAAKKAKVDVSKVA